MVLFEKQIVSLIVKFPAFCEQREKYNIVQLFYSVGFFWPLYTDRKDTFEREKNLMRCAKNLLLRHFHIHVGLLRFILPWCADIFGFFLNRAEFLARTKYPTLNVHVCITKFFRFSFSNVADIHC